jgi:nitrous oxidase accessory protein NosD
VSPKGSDSGAGTRESPLRTIRRAVALARPGDVIRVLPGTYLEQLVLEHKGSGASAVTLRGEGTPLPKIVPSDRTRSSVITVRGRWNLENLHIDVSGAPMFAVVFDRGSNLSRLVGSELHGGTSSAGVLVGGGAHITIEDNSIHHFIKPGMDSHGVVVVGPARNITIRGNDIHHNSGDSVQCQAGEVPAESLLIEGNRMHDEGENGVDIKQCHNVTVRNNFLSGFPNTSIRPAGSSAGEAVVIHQAARNVVIQNNVISRAGRGVSVLAAGPSLCENLRIEGNTIQKIRNFPQGNGQGIRIEAARNVRVVGNTIEGTDSYGLMLAADGKMVTGLVVKHNTLRGEARALLLRLGREAHRPGLVMYSNHYSRGGVLKADGVNERLVGKLLPLRGLFSGEQLNLSSPDRLEAWRRALGVDHGAALLE